MAHPFPEGNVSKPTDSEMRSLFKSVQLLFDSLGQKASPYPEGVRPLPSDSPQRLKHKFNILTAP
jgi:hypothetical protein